MPRARTCAASAIPPRPGRIPVFYAVDAMADDIHEFVSKLRLPSASSLSGTLWAEKSRLALAAKRPAGLAGVVLLAPSPPSPEPMEAAERARLLDGYGDPASARETLGKITAHPLPEELLEAAIADHLHASAPAWRAWLEQGSREDLSSRMAEVEVPVRIVVGEKDKSITGELVEREIRGRLGQSESSLDFLRDVGHLLPLEAPERHGRISGCGMRAVRGGRLRRMAIARTPPTAPASSS